MDEEDEIDDLVTNSIIFHEGRCMLQLAAHMALTLFNKPFC